MNFKLINPENLKIGDKFQVKIKENCPQEFNPDVYQNKYYILKRHDYDGNVRTEGHCFIKEIWDFYVESPKVKNPQSPESLANSIVFLIKDLHFNDVYSDKKAEEILTRLLTEFKNSHIKYSQDIGS